MSARVKSLLEQEYDERENIGIKKGIEKGVEKGKADSVKNLMKNLKMTAEQAMEVIGIPESDYGKYMSML